MPLGTSIAAPVMGKVVNKVAPAVKPMLKTKPRPMTGAQIYGSVQPTGRPGQLIQSVKTSALEEYGAFLEEQLSKIAMEVIPRELVQRINQMNENREPVAIKLAELNGIDFQGEVSLPKIAQILGTKMARIRREHQSIMNGLGALEELTQL